MEEVVAAQERERESKGMFCVEKRASDAEGGVESDEVVLTGNSICIIMSKGLSPVCILSLLFDINRSWTLQSSV